MSILITGMEMPESCDDCILNNGITCYAVPEYKEDGVAGRTDDRPNWCPLVPAADVRPVKRGRWIKHNVTHVQKGGMYLECSCCHEYITVLGHVFAYCPNCGACMEESL